MSAKKPNRLFAPLVIAGITIGFLGAAYKFIFVEAKSTKKEQKENSINPPSKNDVQNNDN